MSRRYSKGRRAAIRRGCRASARSQAARARAQAIVAALRRTGHRHLLAPRIHDAGIRAALERLAPATVPDSEEGRALRYALALNPGSLARFLRRHPELLANPTKEKAQDAARSA